MKNPLSYIPMQIWTIVGIFAIWQAGVMIFDVKPIILPPVPMVLSELFGNFELYLRHGGHTLGNTLIAFVISVVVGIGMAIGIVYSKFLERTLYTLLVTLNNVPKVALAPLFVIWMGTGNASKIAMGVLISIFAIVIDTVLGLRSLHPDLIDLGRAMRGSELKVLIKLRLPNAMPSILAGMKVAISLALVGAIVGEFVAAQNGLGFVILSSQGAFRVDRVYASIIVLSAIGTGLYYAMEYAESKLIPWHESRRGSARPTPSKPPQKPAQPAAADPVRSDAKA
ncbi:ABC transporter permease [Chachezhania antarctica]|uniref:ABC transporter permease n=1 Tax=Chachezhania antarctica TaxID=2340860 RepID=UPI000EB1C3E7|nr:ABC transporter permease [Chachezhania antarctica]|tara:strand:+ start:7836 stop:8681 length:846 start_codon:yes stop_codon:yes gene_type:complete